MTSTKPSTLFVPIFTPAVNAYTNQELRAQLADAQRKADGIDHAHEQMYRCESLYSRGCVQSAAECLLEFANTVPEDMRANKFILGWLADFTQRCVTTLERVGDEASNAGKQDEAVAAYSTALALDPSIPNTVLMKWAIIMLIRGSADEVSTAAIKFNVPRFIVYRVICDILEQDGRVLEAVEYFKQMQNELPEDAAVRNERAEQYTPLKARERWMHVFGFRRRASTKASRPTLCSLFRSICKAAKMTAVQQLFHNRSKLSHWLIGSDI
ncbi:hypothetical protein HD554DRAFT_1826043 [Boletus coccyginus]|nr:hypothetical protein HD554DRAFT_1826043 [Boletus coccyginus]